MASHTFGKFTCGVPSSSGSMGLKVSDTPRSVLQLNATLDFSFLDLNLRSSAQASHRVSVNLSSCSYEILPIFMATLTLHVEILICAGNITLGSQMSRLQCVLFPAISQVHPCLSELLQLPIRIRNHFSRPLSTLFLYTYACIYVLDLHANSAS